MTAKRGCVSIWGGAASDPSLPTLMPPSPPWDDAELMRRVAQQESAALSHLYDRYARLVFSLAYRMLANRDDAEEVVLDVFSQVWRTAGRYQAQRGRVDTWLLILTRSRALDRLRARQRAGRWVAPAALPQDMPAAQTSPEDTVLIEERRQAVRQALGNLPDDQRQVIELAYYQGLSHTEIAAHTGLALGTVKTRLRLALHKLRPVLQALT